MKLMNDLDLSEQRVLIREDLNVPIRDGAITNDARLRAAAPALRAALDQGAAVMVMSHLGRPVRANGKRTPLWSRSRDVYQSCSIALCRWRESGARPRRYRGARAAGECAFQSR